MAKAEKRSLWNIICFIGVIIGILLCYVPVAFVGFKIYSEGHTIWAIVVWIVGGLLICMLIAGPVDKSSDPPLDN